jgi:sensor histidine kinase YesM
MIAIANSFDSLLVKHRWLIHIAFWLFVLLLYSVFFGQGAYDFWSTLFFVGLLLPIAIVSTYILNYYLVPSYLMKGKHLSFLLYFFYTLIGALFLEMWIVVLTFIAIAETNIKAMSPGSINLTFLLAALLLVVFLGVAIKMFSNWQKSKNDYNELMRRKVETEMKFLKTQLNPHFLFNTLNNLYYLSTQKSDEAPKAILALGEMLDYVLKAGSLTLVSVQRELTQLRNYIELERMRYGDRMRIELVTVGDMEVVDIAPMMLITLVENSFKHGVAAYGGCTWIKISVLERAGELKIDISNNWKQVKLGEGIGLENIKSQLDILFPNRHLIQMDTSQSNQFGITITIQSKS